MTILYFLFLGASFHHHRCNHLGYHPIRPILHMFLRSPQATLDFLVDVNVLRRKVRCVGFLETSRPCVVSCHCYDSFCGLGLLVVDMTFMLVKFCCFLEWPPI